MTGGGQGAGRARTRINPSEGAEPGLRGRIARIAAWAWLAPAAGALLLLTPLVRAAADAGAWSLAFYIFGCWAGVILAVAWLSAREAAAERTLEREGAGDPGAAPGSQDAAP